MVNFGLLLNVTIVWTVTRFRGLPRAVGLAQLAALIVLPVKLRKNQSKEDR